MPLPISNPILGDIVAETVLRNKYPGGTSPDHTRTGTWRIWASSCPLVDPNPHDHQRGHPTGDRKVEISRSQRLQWDLHFDDHEAIMPSYRPHRLIPLEIPEAPDLFPPCGNVAISSVLNRSRLAPHCKQRRRAGMPLQARYSEFASRHGVRAASRPSPHQEQKDGMHIIALSLSSPLIAVLPPWSRCASSAVGMLQTCRHLSSPTPTTLSPHRVSPNRNQPHDNARLRALVGNRLSATCRLVFVSKACTVPVPGLLESTIRTRETSFRASARTVV